MDKEEEKPGFVIEGVVTLNGEPIEASLRWNGPVDSGWAVADQEDEHGKPTGAFRIEAAGSGEVKIIANPDDFSIRPFVTPGLARVEGKEGEVVAGVTIGLSLEYEPIRGLVLDTEGRPADGVRVIATLRKGMGSFEAFSKTDGSFLIPVPAHTGPYDCSASLDRERLFEQTVPQEAHPGDDDVTIKLPRIAQCRVRALDARTLEPIEGAAFWWNRAGYRRVNGISPEMIMLWATDPEGWFHLELLEGQVEFFVTAKGYARPTPRPVFARHGEMAQIDFLLERGLELSVLSAEEEPFPSGHTLLLLEERAWNDVRIEEQVIHDVSYGYSDGGSYFPGMTMYHRLVDLSPMSAPLTGLEPGRYCFKVFPNDLVIDPPCIDLTPELHSVEIRWE